MEEQIGRPNVFRDLDSIAPGEHFPTRVARTIGTCTDVFVLIGPAWIAWLPNRRSRLSEPDDWVRLELETAIQRGLHVVPLLIGDARMPSRDVLPPSLHPLCDRQSYELRDAYFVEDVRSVLRLTNSGDNAYREYLGSVAHGRDEQFVELSRLYRDRVEQDGAGFRSIARPQAQSLRPQFDILIDLLEPDEEVADIALGDVYSDDDPADVGSVIKAFRDALISGLVALTPRRLIYVPRLRSGPPIVVWHRDVIDVKKSVLNPLVLVLARRSMVVGLKGSKSRHRDYADYIKNRLVRR